MLRGVSIVTLSAILNVSPGAAAELALPHVSESDATAVEVLLHGAEVVLTCAERNGIGLELRSRRPEGAASAELEIARQGAVLTISGPPREAGPSEIVLELAMPPETLVTVAGSELVVVRTCEARESDHPWPPVSTTPLAGAQPTPQVGSSFELENSNVEYRGPGTARFTGSGNELTLIDTSNDLEVSATGSFVDSSFHHGGLVLDTASSVILLRSSTGRLGARLAGGRLTVLEATGEAVVQLADASVDVENHNGSLSVTARVGDVSVRSSTFSNLAVTGEDAAVQMSGCAATGTINLSRGTLGIEDWAGRLTVQGTSGSDLAVAGVDGDLVLSLDDAAIDLRRVTGHTRATASASDLTLAELKSVALSAQGCLVGVVDVPEVTLLRLAGGELEMSLAEARGRQKLDLLGEAWARVELPTPCEVRLSGEGADEADVDVRGCDLHGGAGPGTQRPRRRRGEGRPAVLEVSLEAAAKLRVEGRSR